MYKFEIEKSHFPKSNKYVQIIVVRDGIIHDEITKLIYSHKDVYRNTETLMITGDLMESVIKIENKFFKIEWLNRKTIEIYGKHIIEVELENGVWRDKIFVKPCEINFFEDCKKCCEDCYKK